MEKIIGWYELTDESGNDTRGASTMAQEEKQDASFALAGEVVDACVNDGDVIGMEEPMNEQESKAQEFNDKESAAADCVWESVLETEGFPDEEQVLASSEDELPPVDKYGAPDDAGVLERQIYELLGNLKPEWLPPHKEGYYNDRIVYTIDISAIDKEMIEFVLSHAEQNEQPDYFKLVLRAMEVKRDIAHMIREKNEEGETPKYNIDDVRSPNVDGLIESFKAAYDRSLDSESR